MGKVIVRRLKQFLTPDSATAGTGISNIDRSK